MVTEKALENARKVSSLIRQAGNLTAYDPGNSRLTATLHALADKLEPVVEQDSAEIIPFPKNPEEIVE